MRILIRYVLFDLIKVFLLVLTVLTLLIFVVLIGKEAVDKGIGLGPLLRMVPYLVPQAMQFAVPGTMLLATTYVYGRLSAYNEIVAIKSLGISPMAIVWPTLALAVLVSFVAVMINDVAVSWGTAGVRRVFLASIEEVTYGQLRMKKTYNLGKANITVRGVEGHKLIWPTLIVQSTGDRPAWTVSAQEAELHLLPDEGKIVVRFHDFELDGLLTYNDPDTFEYVMSVEELTGANPKNRSPSTYALSEIGPAVKEQEVLLDKIEQGLVAQSAFGMLTGDFDSLSETSWKAYEKERTNAEVRLHRLYTEPWRRWANGFSCLCFVLVGVPVAVWMRQADFLASFFICFMPVLLLYYPLLAVSVDQAKDGALPPQSVWVGNVILAIAGAWLMRRVNRN